MTTLDGTRVVVTGGAGLVGSAIVDGLLRQPVAGVVVLDDLSRGTTENLADALGDPRLEVVVGDIRDRALVDDLVADADLVFHQAALRITQCAEDPRLAIDVLVDGTHNVCEAAAGTTRGARVTLLVSHADPVSAPARVTVLEYDPAKDRWSRHDAATSRLARLPPDRPVELRRLGDGRLLLHYDDQALVLDD